MKDQISRGRRPSAPDWNIRGGTEEQEGGLEHPEDRGDKLKRGPSAQDWVIKERRRRAPLDWIIRRMRNQVQDWNIWG